MVIQRGKEYRTVRLSCKNLQFLDQVSCKKTYDEVLGLLISNYKHNNKGRESWLKK